MKRYLLEEIGRIAGHLLNVEWIDGRSIAVGSGDAAEHVTKELKDARQQLCENLSALVASLKDEYPAVATANHQLIDFDHYFEHWLSLDNKQQIIRQLMQFVAAVDEHIAGQVS